MHRFGLFLYSFLKGEEMDFKIIAVDFDGTLCEDMWPKIGKLNLELFAYLKAEQEKGNKIILWTCRKGRLLEQAISKCRRKGLIFDSVNENLPEVLEWMGGNSRKIFAHEYIDDRNSKKIDLPFVWKGSV